ncbi:hypothetical protein [Weissella koreensis]|uniref:Uncharacterized protein n=1 Tax=Weissella koreensis TaxID=165096 RepID=A0A7H1MLJ7_9LACO|nr:hypothetical protein [Weissella koreensis]AEJ23495.1 hypothetical protein WKK_03105 [Weissella koreensis KACC 15510]AVH75129.1 hypothetical protein C4597_03415 [Weissella koreensis]EJF33540.1 hypothetical protein JC2156_09020 [Weissella koreensis KCTC 3621]QGN20355.1 hypothetical protein GKC51_03400 [Weissella koreensis]QNT64333.1 hypothetical protein FY536_03120 [Weissella koreensis]
MTHKTHTSRSITTGSIAVASIPVMMISAGITALMAAKAYQIIRLANAYGTMLEKEKHLND